MLELYQMEDCQFCRKVRLKLEELDLDYIVRSARPGSKKRDFLGNSGRAAEIQVPLLVEQEKNIFMFESGDICDYLEKTYRRSASSS